MKKTTKRITVMALCIVMLLMSAIPAFAVETTTGPVENHTVIDCTNRYKMEENKFNFTIKLPAGTELSSVTMEITRDCEGSRQFYDNLMYFSNPSVFGTTLTLKESYGGSDYYEFITHAFSADGVGIKLYMTYNGVRYMATDTANGSTTEGRGYWLDA